MKLAAMLGALAALGLAAPAGGEPARPAPPEPAAAAGLREAPLERRDALRDRRLQVTLSLKGGTFVQGVLEDYESGKDGQPGSFSLDGGKTTVVESDVVKVAVGEVVKEPRPAHRELPPEVLKAIKAGMAEQIIERRRAALKKTIDFEVAKADLRFLAAVYRHQGLVGKPLSDRLQADVDAVENERVRAELRKLLQDERFIWARPLRPGAGRGPAADKQPEKL